MEQNVTTTPIGLIHMWNQDDQDDRINGVLRIMELDGAKFLVVYYNGSNYVVSKCNESMLRISVKDKTYKFPKPFAKW